ncbi:MAG: hypothetical protein H6626_02345 [Pseudobdellovibrionaceae bacterium]|nr:hypothetical protein [Bdellovibrionales bacterium]USN47952.1 MAG: hypothetical protein H6626_02345 [Pseudobdellovibrionaceae bacterium]
MSSLQITTGAVQVEVGGILSNSLESYRIFVKQISDPSFAPEFRPEVLCNGFIVGRGWDGLGRSKLFSYSLSDHVLYQVGNTDPGSNDNPEIIECFDNKVYFWSERANRRKIFKYDTSAAHVSQVSNISNDQNTGELSSEGFVTNGNWYFWAYNNSGVMKLFELNFNSEAITQVSNLSGVQTAGDTVANGLMTWFQSSGKIYIYSYLGQWYEFNPLLPSFTLKHQNALKYFALANGFLYFFKQNGNGAFKMYKHDIATDALTQLSNTSGDQSVSDATFGGLPMFLVGNKIYFGAQDSGLTQRMYGYNINTDEIRLVANTFASMTEFNGKGYFQMNNNLGAKKLHQIDPVNDQIREISNTRGDRSLDDWTPSLFAFGDRLYFSSRNSHGVFKLFSYDDVENVFLEVSNTRQDVTLDDIPYGYFEVNGHLYFASLSPAGGAMFRLCDERLSGVCNP